MTRRFDLRAAAGLAVQLAGWFCAILIGVASTASAAEVPDVRQRPLTEARQLLGAAGFTIQLVGGDPAPTPALAFAVQAQFPAAGSAAAPGSVVTLRVYSAGAADVVPDVRGTTAAAARRVLQGQGFEVVLEGGDPAPGPELAFRVQSQNPCAACPVPAERRVVLRIHGDVDTQRHAPAARQVVNPTPPDEAASGAVAMPAPGASTIPELSAAHIPAFTAAGEQQPLDRGALLELFRRYQHLDELRRDPDRAPDVGAWLDLAAALKPHFDRTLAFDQDGDDPYLWRAKLLYGQCQLFASVALYHRGASTAQLAAYHLGLTALEAVLKGFRTARSLHESGADACELIPEQRHPYARTELAGATDRSLYPVLRQRPTSEVAAERLSEFCPWGHQLFTLLEEAGYTHGLDWRILLPYGGNEIQLASVATLTSNLPPALEADMNAAQRGLIRHLGQDLVMTWERPPAAPTTMVWFASPTLEAGNASIFVTWGLRLIKLLVGGPLDLAADEAMNQLVDLIGKEYGADSKVYAASGLAVNLNNYGLDSDFLLEGKDFASGKPPKEALKGLLGWLEQRTLEMSFDGIDPGNAAVRTQVGSPKSYDGSAVPAILVRGDLLGFEAVPPERYRRTWNVVRFHQLDPRSVAGGDYDLSQQAVERLPGSGALLDSSRAAAVWPQLPGALGSRLMLTDFTPQIQVLRLAVHASALAQWRQIAGEGQTLVALLQADPGASPALAWHEIDDGEISFTIKNELQLQRDGTIENIFFPEESKGSLRSTDPRHPYTIRIAVCTKSAPRYEPGALFATSAIDWRHPRRILAERTGRFLKRGGLAHNGKISSPRKGCELLEMSLDPPAPPASAPAPAGEMVGFVDQAWFEEWTGRHFRFAQEAGSRDDLQIKPLRMSCRQGGCTLTGGDYALQRWTQGERRGGSQGYQKTIAKLSLDFTTAAATAGRVSGRYLARGEASTQTTFPLLFRSTDLHMHPQVQVEGNWVAERVPGSESGWTVHLEPLRATIAETAVPVVFRLEEE